MKVISFLIVMIASSLFGFNENQFEIDDLVEQEIHAMAHMANPTLEENPEHCSDVSLASSVLCSCVAAGNCKWDPFASGCYIVFCDGNVVSNPSNSKADNITTIVVPCVSEA